MQPAFPMSVSTDIGKAYLPAGVLDVERIVIECPRCGPGTYTPRLDEMTARTLYSDDYHVFQKTAEGAAAANNRNGEFAAALLRSELDALGIRPAGPHLDVGCAFGGLLANSWLEPKYGIEVGTAALRWLQAHTAFTVSGEPLHPDSFPGVTFGLVTLLDVAEHLPDPVETLRVEHDKLAEDGVLVLTTPDFRGIRRRLRGPAWRMIQLEHLWYFTAPALKRILSGIGFADVHVLHSNRMTDTLVEPGEFFAGLPAWLLWLNVPGIRRLALAILRRVGWTDDLKIVAVKR